MTESEMTFEIVPYSRMENLNLVTHERIRNEASRKLMLSMHEKMKVNKAISSTQSNYNREPVHINSYVVFMGGWYCKPLRKYLKDEGYKVSPCGNDFDLWINLLNK